MIGLRKIKTDFFPLILIGNIKKLFLINLYVQCVFNCNLGIYMLLYIFSLI